MSRIKFEYSFGAVIGGNLLLIAIGGNLLLIAIGGYLLLIALIRK